MENRYLFRGKRIDNNEWEYGLPSYDEDGEIEEIEVWSEDDINFYSVDPSTVCQCTGLKDKNGKLIWENDIVSYCDCTKEDYVISWEQNKACFEYQQYSCSMMNFDELSSCEVEVIGNVFDNPELLEV